MTKLRRAAIVAPIRTPVGKFGGALSSLNAGELGGIILKALVERTKIDPPHASGIGHGWPLACRLKCPATRSTVVAVPGFRRL
jgi:acetyl-CoA acetyltransferase